MPGPRIVSVNVGRGAASEHARAKVTGIDKRPVPSIEVHDPGPRRPRGTTPPSGVSGDVIGDRQHHGGTSQAVYAVSREELDWWERELGRALPDGSFGENLTTADLDVDHAVVGTRWRIGEVVLSVTGPRIPCRTFAGHLGERGWVRRYTEHGLSGAYLAVEVPGRIDAGAAVVVEEVPDHGITVPQVLRAFTGDRDAARQVVAARVLLEPHHSTLATLVEPPAAPSSSP